MFITSFYLFLCNCRVNKGVKKSSLSKKEPAKSTEKPAALPKKDKKFKKQKTSGSGNTPESLAPANIMFIFDASGSMWGQVEGKAKIVIAKEVMINLINDLPDNTKAGLVVYGHRRKGDCSDVEELSSLSALDKKKFAKIINDINPKGKTPITRSVKITAEKLKVLEDTTTIILVSDGKETCEGDPCALVRELKKSGLKFIMHVIGFDVTKHEKEQLECMAKEGGGKYYSADNADQLQMAAKDVVKETTLPPQTGFLRITAMRDGKIIKALARYFHSNKTKRVFQNSTPVKDEDPGEKLKPGLYDVIVIDRETSGSPQVKLENIKVEAGKTVEQKCDFSGGTLSVSVVKNGKPSFAWITVYESGTDKKTTNTDTSSGNPSRLKLVPGKYDVVALDDKVSPPQKIILRDINIKAGEAIEKTVNFSEGKLSMTSLINGKKKRTSYYVYQAGTRDKVTSSDISRKHNPKIIKLAPGIYDLLIRNYKVKPKEEKWFKGIQIKGNHTNEKTAEFEEGILVVKTTSNGKETKSFLKIFQEGEKKKLCTSYTSKKIRLVPGDYELYINAYKLPGEPQKYGVPVTIKAGETNNLNVKF